MATKSSNTQGNPYHDESTGEFTSANGGGKKEKVLKLNDLGQSNLQQMKDDIQTPTNPSNVFKLKLKANLEDIRHNLQQSHQIASIPLLGSARDVEEHLESFFPSETVKKIDSYFGKFAVPYKFFNLRTDPQQRCGVNIFAACIGKKRWKNNYLRLIDANEYNNLAKNPSCVRLYRGLRGNDEMFHTIANSYSSKENEMIYGSVGGTSYGIAVYSSDERWEAVSYAGSNSNHVMDLILDKNSKTMSYRNICRIRDDLSYRKNEIVSKVEKIFTDNGIEPSRAKQMAASFGITLGDEGFVAMLCGVEWYQSGSYHMIENLGSMYRLLK